jgi:hypothetical protein
MFGELHFLSAAAIKSWMRVLMPAGWWQLPGMIVTATIWGESHNSVDRSSEGFAGGDEKAQDLRVCIGNFLD